MAQVDVDAIVPHATSSLVLQLTHVLLTALLSLYPPPASIRHRIDAHHDTIVSDATRSADRYEVPVSVLLVVGFLETHLGVDRGEGGGWGAPIDRFHRHVAGNSDTAASALAWGFRACHSWRGAVAHYRCGRCACRRLIGYTEGGAMHAVDLVNRRARSVR